MERNIVQAAVQAESLMIESFDGFRIRIMYYAPLQPTNSSLPAVLVLPATGVQAAFYDSFCKHLASAGMPCCAVDYRFIGASLPDGVDRTNREQFAKTLQQNPDVTIARDYKGDVETALAWLIRKHPDRSVVAACHSVGGHLVTLVKPELAAHIKRVLFFGVFFPSYCYSSFEELKRASCAEILQKCDRLGYFDSRSIGLGSDLPAGVGKQWVCHVLHQFQQLLPFANGARKFGWMEHPDYYRHDTAAILDKFRAPVLSLVTTDDVMLEQKVKGPDANLLALPNSPATRVQFDPERLSWPEIGHIDVFKPQHADGALWRIMTLWLRDGVVDVSKSKEKAKIRHFRGGVMSKAKSKL